MLKLNTILKNFRKTREQLDAYMNQENKVIEANDQKVADLTADNHTRREQVKKAEKARDKIADFLGDE